jgi:hypothetical protein
MSSPIRVLTDELVSEPADSREGAALDRDRAGPTEAILNPGALWRRVARALPRATLAPAFGDRAITRFLAPSSRSGGGTRLAKPSCHWR